MIKILKPILPCSGRIKIGRKGEKKVSAKGNDFQQPEKLDHFIIVRNERGEDGNFIEDSDLMDKIKKNGGIVNQNGNLIGIPIQLMYNDIELNFQHSLAAFAGSKCICTGDGEKAVNVIQGEMDCPCNRLMNGTSEQCKYTGRLSVMIEGATFNGVQIFGGCHDFRTTGKTSVEAIVGGMMAIQSRTGGQLAFLPLLLIIQPIHTQFGKAYSAGIVFNGHPEELTRIAIENAAKRGEFIRHMAEIEAAQKAIAYNKPFDGDEAEFASEFWPGQVATVERNDPTESVAVVVEATKPAKEALPTNEPGLKPDVEKPTESKPVEATHASAPVSVPFGGRKSDCVKIYRDCIEADCKRWVALFDDKGIAIHNPEIENLVQSPKRHDESAWTAMIKSFYPNIDDFKFVGYMIKSLDHNGNINLWHKTLKKFGVEKAKELSPSNVNDFIRDMTDIPF